MDVSVLRSEGVGVVDGDDDAWVGVLVDGDATGAEGGVDHLIVYGWFGGSESRSERRGRA